MAITRSQQARQMLKEAGFVVQDGFKNYIKNSESVTVPKEFKSKEDLITFRNKWSKWWPDNVHNALSRTSIRTSENSLLLLATYETEEIADEAKAIIETFFNVVAEHVHDINAFHGEVMDDRPNAVME